jgi:hypothetical protein
MEAIDFINDAAEYWQEPILLADGFEEAALGYTASQPGPRNTVAVYDYNKCVDILVRQGMDEGEAVEYMDFNVTGSWMGPYTPLFLVLPAAE